MARQKQSGHARLKSALVLRDALAAELGLPLPRAMAALLAVEQQLGAGRALHEGRYLDALASLCSGEAELLTQLDLQVRDACTKAQLAPRYAQYLAIYLFAAWLHAKHIDETAFLSRLNAYQAAHPSKIEKLQPFCEIDLQFAAFWMATAAGKTHVLHACLALLTSNGTPWDRLIIVTPSEPLTRQHADKLKGLGQWEVFAYPMDGDALAMGRLARDVVIVLDINKLADEKKGEGVTVPTSVFKDGRNLVFVDEGHKGQKSEESTWKKLQIDLAGIDLSGDMPMLEKHRGLLVEFSATFGQVAEMEHAFGRYAKSIIFDYAYDRFHTDLYGKDFWHVQLDGRGEVKEAVQQQTLTAALLSFWYQMQCYRSGAAQQELADLGVSAAAPLWVLLGLSVIGGKNKSDQEQTSDVIEVLKYLAAILENPAQFTSWVHEVVNASVDGSDILPAAVCQALVGQSAQQISERILSNVFAWQPGDKPIFRLLKSATGEMGLGLLRGDGVHYYGVVNVGDAAGLKKALDGAKLVVGEDVLTPSLFDTLSHGDSGTNILIGSRRFAEGWDNYRASSLTLLRLGQGEGSLIIQMFGRVVRFAGTHGDGKRLAKPSAAIKPLQTAYVYGLRSAYLEAFLSGLYAHGVPETRSITCPFHLNLPDPSPLKSVQAVAPQPTEFIVQTHGGQWLLGVNKVRISLAATVTTAGIGKDGVSVRKGLAGEDLTTHFKLLLPLIDHDAIYREMVEVRRQLRWWNFSFDKPAIRHALESDRYEVFGLASALQVRREADLLRINRMAAALVRRLFEGAYRKQENKFSRYSLIEARESGIPKEYRKDFIHVEEA